MRQGSAILRIVQRLAMLGVAATDTEETRAQKATLTLAAISVTVLAVIWVGTYAALGLFTSAAIPLIYQLASITSLGVCSSTSSPRQLPTG